MAELTRSEREPLTTAGDSSYHTIDDSLKSPRNSLHLSNFRYNDESSEQQENIRLIVAMGIIIVYVLFGGLIFLACEKDHEEDLADEYSDLKESLALKLTPEEYDLATEYMEGTSPAPDKDNPNWDFPGSCFFSLTLITTIGYGAYTPHTNEGKAFAVMYGILGICLMLYLMSTIAERMILSVLRTHDKWLEYYYGNNRPEVDSKRVKVFVFISMSVLCVFAILFGAILAYVQEDWSFGNCLYFSFITLSTVGFGDYTPGLGADDSAHKRVVKIIMALWLVAGLAVVATTFQAVNIGIKQRLEKTTAERLANYRASRNNARSTNVASMRTDDVKISVVPDSLTVASEEGNSMKHPKAEELFYQ